MTDIVKDASLNANKDGEYADYIDVMVSNRKGVN